MLFNKYVDNKLRKNFFLRFQTKNQNAGHTGQLFKQPNFKQF
jgi:hypothetical protein